MSRPAVAFRPVLLTGSDADYDAQNRNNRELARAIERLQLPGGAVAAVTSTGPLKFIASKNGAGPWSWTGLNGDAAGARGFLLRFRVTKAAAGAHTLALRFNGDTGANYTDATGLPTTSARFAINLAGSNESTEGIVEMPVARSGGYRNVIGAIQAADNSPQTYAGIPDSAWINSTDPVTQIDVINATGTVDAGDFALFQVMDVA